MAVDNYQGNLSLSSKIRLQSTCIIPILLYGVEARILNAAEWVIPYAQPTIKDPRDLITGDVTM